MFWNRKLKDRIRELESYSNSLEKGYEEKLDRVKELQLKLRESKNQPSMAELMKESLGMTIDFSLADNKTCLPPHYLDGLDSEARKNFIADMETVYSNEKYQAVVRYLINLFALNAVFKDDKEKMKNNQMAVVAIRTLSQEFDKIHLEFLEQKKDPDTLFDEQELL